MDLLTEPAQLMGARVVLVFSGENCQPCKMMAPLLKHLEPKFPLLKFLSVDVEHELAAQFDIVSIPTIVVLFGGREIRRISGLMNRIALEQWLAQSV